MSNKLKKIGITLAAAFVMCTGVMKLSSTTKAMWPQPGVPAYAMPVSHPHPGVPAYYVAQSVPTYTITINNPNNGPAFNLPYPPVAGIARVPSFYKQIRLVDFSTNRVMAIIPITRNSSGCYGYQYMDRFYVINYC